MKRALTSLLCLASTSAAPLSEAPAEARDRMGPGALSLESAGRSTRPAEPSVPALDLIVAVSGPMAPETPDPATPATPEGFDPGLAGFTLTVNGALEVRYRIMSVSVMPGEQVELEAAEGVTILSDRTLAEGRGAVRVWQAPDEPGYHNIVAALDGETITLNIFVLRPADEIRNGVLGGYRIGAYPSEPYRGLDAYRAPRGYIEVTPDMTGLQISPHFTLGQFLCKQTGDWPHYAVVQERLLVKLERLLTEVNAAGWRAETFVVMSGYRTPAYNSGLGNGSNSRHVYGDAADIYIDADGDGVMDDLNGDGVLDRRDAAVLYDFIDSLLERPDFSAHIGGLGAYGPNAYHGPFVHVDERGWNARWGRSPS